MWDTITPGSTYLFPRECWALKTLHLECVFFLFNFSLLLDFEQRTAPALTSDKMHGVQGGQAGYKQKDLQTLPRQGKMVFQIFLPLKMVCQVF